MKSFAQLFVHNQRYIAHQWRFYGGGGRGLGGAEAPLVLSKALPVFFQKIGLAPDNY